MQSRFQLTRKEYLYDKHKKWKVRTGSDTLFFFSFSQNWRGGVGQVRHPGKSGVREIPSDSHLQFSQKQNVQHTEQEQGRNVNSINNKRNAPVGLTDAFSYFCLTETFMMLHVQYAGVLTQRWNMWSFLLSVRHKQEMFLEISQGRGWQTKHGFQPLSF